MGRRPVLSAIEEAEVGVLLDRGIRQQTIAQLFKVSPRTISRVVARRRDRIVPLDELLAAIPSIEQVLAAAPSARAPRRRRSRGWRVVAAKLEADAPQRWGPSLGS